MGQEFGIPGTCAAASGNDDGHELRDGDIARVNREQRDASVERDLRPKHGAR